MNQPGPIPNDQGLLRQVDVTAPGAGNDVALAISTNVRWRLKSVHAILTTDATVANRFARLGWGLTSNDFNVHAGLIQTASQAITYDFLEGGPDRTTAINSTLNVNIPHKLLLNDAFVLALFADNMQAGDAWTAIRFIVEEWAEE